MFEDQAEVFSASELLLNRFWGFAVSRCFAQRWSDVLSNAVEPAASVMSSLHFWGKRAAFA